MKAALLPSSSATSTSQWRLLAFKVEKDMESSRESIHSSLHGMRQKSRMVIALGLLESTQKWSVWSFLAANKIGAATSVGLVP